MFYDGPEVASDNNGEMIFNINSDNYIMKWGNHGMPKDIDMLNNLRAIFTVSFMD